MKIISNINILIIFIFCSIFQNLFAQPQIGSKIFGNIVDAETREPIAYANIFISNSSIGTASDENGYFELRDLPIGRYEIIASILGYEVLKADVRIYKYGSRNFRFEMYKQPIEMEEVIVKGKKSWKRRRYLKYFRKNFLGSSENGEKAYITNEEVIRFEEKGSILFAYANEPIEIINNGLGYKIFYILDEYQQSANNIKYIGYPHFVEQIAKTYNDSINWSENREKTYLGSLRHFFTTICDNYKITNGDTAARPFVKDWDDIVDYRTKVIYADSSLVEDEGFYVIQIQNLFGSNQQGKNRLVNTNWFLSEANNANEMFLQFDNYLQVSYNNELYPFNNLTDLRTVSWIQMTCDSTVLDKKGRYFDKYAIQTIGLWSNERVADMLPFDYEIKGK